VKDLLLPHGCVVVLVIGDDGAPKHTSPETAIQAGDDILAVTPTENEEALRTILTQA
jgi:hypothetical protein